MTKVSRFCIRPGFYRGHYPALPADEARLLLLAAYSEKELDPELQKQVESHLAVCSECTATLKDLESIDDLKSDESVLYAVCPSSEILDRYLFEKAKLSQAQKDSVEEHLKKCELCRGEVEWLNEVESKPKTGDGYSRSWKQSVLAAAAALFLAISAFLFWQTSQNKLPEEKLKSIAVIKEPDQIDYDTLIETSSALEKTSQAEFDRALSAFRSKRFDEAAQLFQKIISRDPEHSASLYLLGYSYYKLNQEQRAFELCSKAEGIRPHSYERCMFLVNLALKTGHFDRARIEISTLYHELPDVPEVQRLYHQIMELSPKGTAL